MKIYIQFLIFVAFSLLFAWFLKIDPTHEYGWFLGMIQGGLFVPNWIISLFSSDWLTSAPLHTGNYNLFWWIGTISCVCYWARYILVIIAGLFFQESGSYSQK